LEKKEKVQNEMDHILDILNVLVRVEEHLLVGWYWSHGIGCAWSIEEASTI
jgi:hypothetical protein